MKRKKRTRGSQHLPDSHETDLEGANDLAGNQNDDSGTVHSKLGRRRFLLAGTGAAAAALVTPIDVVALQKPKGPVRHNECNAVEFSEPHPVSARSIGGQSVLNWTLNAEPYTWTYTCPGQAPTSGRPLPVFNGHVPGPTLFIDPGTKIELTLNNRLNLLPPFPGDNCPAGHMANPPNPSCFQHTNLHTHGLTVSPCSVDSHGQKHCGEYLINGTNPPLKCSSDDVLVDIFPGQSNRYCIVLPDFHAPGTNWYHSHLHGSSAYQVSSGMAGAIIIREPPGQELVREDLDKVLMMQEVLLSPTNQPQPGVPPVYGSPGSAPQSSFFVNGLCRPTMKMFAGQTMRWRFINATGTPRGLLKLRLVKSTTCDDTVPPAPTKAHPDHLMHLIAIDGLSFYGVPPQPVRYHIMGSGNRADFLINIKEPGIYKLVKDGFPLESVQNPSSTDYTFASAGSTAVLAYIVVQPSNYNEVIPPIITGIRPRYLEPIWTVDTTRAAPIKFQNPGAAKFQIDNNYYPMNTAIQAKLNTAQQITLQNTGFNGAPQTNTHPFHVHINPFQVLDVAFDFEVADADLNGRPRMDPKNPCTWPFWDTVPIPAQIPPQTGPPGQLTIRTRFLVYDGEYVSHCHILVHEDVGMMINVKIDGSGVGPNEVLHDYPPAAKACIDRTTRRC
jgi:FtsP/CotA-like multicopper oxidase with cupredoxin domain